MRRLLLAATVLALALAPPARADAETEAKAIIDKAIQAHGGADKLAKQKAGLAKMKGKVEVNGMSIDYTVNVSLQDDKMRVESEIEVQNNKIAFLQIVNGDKGWYKVLNQVKEMDKDQVAEAREQLHAGAVASLAPLGGKGYKFSPLGESKVDGKDAVGVQVSYKDRRDVNLHFDKKTGLLVKTETRSKDAFSGNDNEFTAETIYSNYKEFGGVKRATKHTIKRDGKDFGDAELTEFEARDNFDDSTFAKP